MRLKMKSLSIATLSVGSLIFSLSGCLTLGPNSGKAQSTGGPTAIAEQQLLNTIDDLVASAEAMRQSPTHSDRILPYAEDLDQVAGSYEQETPGERQQFDVAISDANIRDVVLGLVEGTGYNVVVHPSVNGTISLSLKSVTVPEVMEVLRDVYGYEYQRKGASFYLMPQQRKSQVFQVNYLHLQRVGTSKMSVAGAGSSDGRDGGGTTLSTESSSDLWTELQSTLEALVGEDDENSVIVSPQSGMVVVRAMPKTLRSVGKYLNSLQDNLNRQVILEAKIIEVELSDGFQSGVDWSALARSGSQNLGLSQIGSGILGAGNTNRSTGTLNPNTPAFPDQNATQRFGGIFSAALQLNDFTAFIELLKQQGKVQVLSSPRVSTLNNQKAIIKVGEDEYFVTGVRAGTTGSTGSTGPDVTLENFFSGIALDVTPQIDQKGGVTLHIHPSVSRVTDHQKQIDLGTEQLNFPLAQSSVRESDSVVRAQSGQLIVIGGLMQSQLSDQLATLPGLEDSILGSVFGHTKQTMTKSELVILLRPIVIDGGSDWANQIQQYTNRLR